jgi:probable O-glycosylation ligase (exosortase A-associated)
MSQTALAWVVAYTTSAFMAFVNPVYGLFGYFLDYYGHPPLRWWGKELPDLRWSLIISLITLVSVLIHQAKPLEVKTESNRQVRWLVLLVFTSFLVTPTMAVVKDQSWDKVIELIKLGVLYFLIIKTIRTKEDFHYLILIQIVGVFLWGWSAFEDPKRVDGRLSGIGGPDSIRDNGTAAHLLGVLPFIGVVFLEGKVWEKVICLIAAPFVLNAFVLCNSRGAFVGLILTGLYTLLITKGRLRRKMVVGLSMGAVLFYSLMDPQFIERQKTIQNYEEDSSASSRIELWKAGLNLIKDHPLGVGGGGYDALSPIYAAEVVEAYGNERTAHNTYVLVASEWGLLGFIFFAAFLISTFRELHGLRKIPPTTPEQARLHLETYAIELGLFGVLAAGIFTNRLYAEAIYWLPAFAAVVKRLYLNERQETSNHNHALPA